MNHSRKDRWIHRDTNNQIPVNRKTNMHPNRQIMTDSDPERVRGGKGKVYEYRNRKK